MTEHPHDVARRVASQLSLPPQSRVVPSTLRDLYVAHHPPAGSPQLPVKAGHTEREALVIDTAHKVATPLLRHRFYCPGDLTPAQEDTLAVERSVVAAKQWAQLRKLDVQMDSAGNRWVLCTPKPGAAGGLESTLLRQRPDHLQHDAAVLRGQSADEIRAVCFEAQRATREGVPFHKAVDDAHLIALAKARGAASRAAAPAGLAAGLSR